MSGTNTVASMVVFRNGVSDRTNYRKFKMTRPSNDDTANMREVITRRLSATNIKAWGMPDLILIDGGRGQLNASMRAMELAGVAVPMMSIAKREEEIVVAKNAPCIRDDFLRKLMTNPIAGVSVLESGGYYFINLHVGRHNAGGHSRNLRGGETHSPYDELTKLFQRIRDESHRFAVSYHTTLKRKDGIKSQLDEIQGIGPAIKKKLLRRFGSVRGVGQASEEELRNEVGPKLATRIRAHIATDS